MAEPPSRRLRGGSRPTASASGFTSGALPPSTPHPPTLRPLPKPLPARRMPSIPLWLAPYPPAALPHLAPRRTHRRREAGEDLRILQGWLLPNELEALSRAQQRPQFCLQVVGEVIRRNVPEHNRRVALDENVRVIVDILGEQGAGKPLHSSGLVASSWLSGSTAWRGPFSFACTLSRCPALWVRRRVRAGLSQAHSERAGRLVLLAADEPVPLTLGLHLPFRCVGPSLSTWHDCHARRRRCTIMVLDQLSRSVLRPMCLYSLLARG